MAYPSVYASAQQTGGTATLLLRASRESLEWKARAAHDSAFASGVSQSVRQRKLDEERAIRTRLEAGDFSVGDRIILRVTGEPTLTDTFTVQPGPALVLPKLDSISLRGVLFAELQEHIRKALDRYIRNPEVVAEPLIRLAVTGSVQRPGFVYVRSNLLVSDVIMLAGGPAPNANLAKVSAMRGGSQVVNAAAMQDAITRGASLAQLGLRGGDEITVARRRDIAWSSILQGASILLGLTAAIFGLSR